MADDTNETAPDFVVHPNPPRRGRMTGILAGLALLLGLAGVASPFWGPLAIQMVGEEEPAQTPPQPERDSAEIKQIQRQITELASSVIRLDGTMAEAGAGSAKIAGRVDSLHQQQNTLRARLDGFQKRWGEQIDKMSGELTGLTGLVAEAQQAEARLIQRLDTRIAALAAEIAGLPDRLDETRVRLTELDTNLRPRLDTLHRRVAAMGEALSKRQDDVAKLRDEMVAVSERVDAIAVDERRANRIAVGNTGLLIALGQLRNAASGDRPFAAAMARVLSLYGTLYPENPPQELAAPLSDLEPIASIGAPSRSRLRVLLSDQIDVLAEQEGLQTGEGWLEQTLARIGEPVVIRPRGSQARSDKPSAIAARAEVKLAKGDLSAAYRDILAIEGEAGRVLSAWAVEAGLRLRVEQSLAGLDGWIADELQTKPTPSEKSP